ncbi:hypothetical protein [Mesorhizobium sp. CAU 1741]|uniref:hypothetical protein n=1 Tax=Mesorhizobium sp. CAU 1741 TaxID=3140366 RepID=UPI00325C23F8
MIANAYRYESTRAKALEIDRCDDREACIEMAIEAISNGMCDEGISDNGKMLAAHALCRALDITLLDMMRAHEEE